MILLKAKYSKVHKSAKNTMVGTRGKNGGKCNTKKGDEREIIL
jgi:hypothetical protein